MLFHSQVFVLAFLPAVVALYYALAKNVAARDWLLILASAIFYGWWDLRFLPLIVGQVTVAWLIGEIFARNGRRWLLPAGIAANLTLLGIFKYFDFFAANIGALLGETVPPSGIILPIGISFLTFQVISYLFDLARGGVPRYPLRRFALFIMFFPHLIAGPIVRHSEIIPQFDLDPYRPGLSERLTRGIALFVMGFAAKLFVADKLAVHADLLFQQAAIGPLSLVDAWSGALAFAMQIYFDFSGYSEMATGIALMFGLHFPMNFDLPYRATSLRDFWRRWHMSLSRFFRDYLYVPLGGDRMGFGRFVWATMVTMGLCGLWHGAGWPFIVWGLVHGAGLVVCRAWQNWGRPLPAMVAWLLTFVFVVVAFVLFRAPDLATAVNVLIGMSGATGIGTWPARGLVLLLLTAGALHLLKQSNVELARTYMQPSKAAAAVLAAVAFYGIVEVGRGQPVSFIYFQF